MKDWTFTEQNTIEYWDKLYDQKGFTAYCYRQRMDVVLSWLDALDLSKNSMILDAGCGAGRFAREAAKRGYSVFAIDNSFGMLVNASGRGNSEEKLNISYLQGDLEAIPLRPASVDVIVCLGVVGYLNSDAKALDALATALKPGGILMISIVNKARFVYRLDLPLLFMNLVKKLLHKTVPSRETREENANRKKPSLLRTYFIPKFRKSLELAGFQVLEYKTVPWKLLTFCGKEVFPQRIATNITLFFEQFSNVPLVESLGGMGVFKAIKNSLR